MGIVIAVAVAGAIAFAVERVRPGRDWPEERGFWPRVVALNLAQVAVVAIAGVLWDPWLAARRPWSADALGTFGGAALGYLAITFVYYFWHRARHEVPFLWRWFHQVHHSPSRLEVVVSFYKHPFEVAVNGVLSSVVLYGLVGLGPAAATLAVAATGLAELFYHWNVRTPHWVGFLFQRPEMHCVHHEEGRHASNYSDLPLWDLLFGTFDNPPVFDRRCGFGARREERLGEMLLGRDVVGAVDDPASPDADLRDRPRWSRAGAFILVLGLAQIGAAAVGAPRVQGALAATSASPAPKVFSSVRGLETHTSRFHVEWRERDGTPRAIELTPERYAALQGPYARRNAYGAAVAYGPVLAADPRTTALFSDVATFGLCGDAPLLRELGVEPSSVSELRIRVEPRAGSEPDAALPLTLEPECDR